MILNRWTEYCSELYNYKANGNPSVLNCTQTDTEDDHPILFREVETAVQSLKKGKSAGVDNIRAVLVQAGGEDLTSWHSLHSQRHGDQCREDQAGDKQHQWHQHRDQSEWTEAWDSHKLQIPGLSYNLRGFQAWDTLQDSTDNSSIDNAETSFDWQEYFSQLQDTTDAFPYHIYLPVC